MSYYILPKINNQIAINATSANNEELKPYISYSLLNYFTSIKEQINKNIINANDLSHNTYNELIKLVNPCEFIFSKVPGSKYSVSKLKPNSNLFYDFLEVCNVINVFDIYEKMSISSLHITNNVSDTIECFEMLRENFNDTIKSYNGFDKETLNQIDNLNEKFDFLAFEEEINELNKYFEFLSNCMLTIFKCQKINGSCIIKIDNIFYKPVIDFLYILSSLFEKVYIFKPNTTNITSFEKYIICKNYKTNDFSRVNYYNLQQLNQINNINNTIVGSFLDFDISYYFLSKIDDINIILGHQQIEYLDLVLNILKNKNREDKIESYKKINILKSVAWCEKYKIPCNRFSEKVNIFLPIVNKVLNGNEEIKINYNNDFKNSLEV
jgi:hypothetical protein